MKLSLAFLFFTLGLALANLSNDQKHRCEQYTSIFENDSTTLAYSYCENIHDGRGFTSGRAGFCTGTGDAVVVVQKYTQKKPGNPLAHFLPELEKLARSGSGSTSQLSGYCHAWTEAAKDSEFHKIQDEVSDDMYYNPAMHRAEAANVQTALGQCAFYDAVIQHGDGDDGDSLSALIKATEKDMNGKVNGNEHQWIEKFLAVRRHDLTNPHNKETQAEWKGSVDRVDAMTALAKANNWDMHPPMHIKTVNHDKTIN